MDISKDPRNAVLVKSLRGLTLFFYFNLNNKSAWTIIKNWLQESFEFMEEVPDYHMEVIDKIDAVYRNYSCIISSLRCSLAIDCHIF